MNESARVINLAPTGMVPTKSHTPHVPVQVDEVVSDIQRCVPMGVSMVHVHARDAAGQPTTDRDTWLRLMSAIREAETGVVLVGTTSGRNTGEFSERAQVLNLPEDCRPDMASLTLGSLNFLRQSSANSPDMIRRLAARMAEQGVKPELEVFDLGMLNFAQQLIREDLLQPPYYFNLMLGNIATAQTKLTHLAALMADVPEDSVVCFGGLGRYQQRAMLLGIAVANGVRTGLEDNIWLDRTTEVLASNESLVRRAAEMIQAAGLHPATVADVRKELQLKRDRPSIAAA